MSPAKKAKQKVLKDIARRGKRAFERRYKKCEYWFAPDAKKQAKALFVHGFITAERLAKKAP
jgi:hypothetical protein